MNHPSTIWAVLTVGSLALLASACRDTYSTPAAEPVTVTVGTQKSPGDGSQPDLKPPARKAEPAQSTSASPPAQAEVHENHIQGRPGGPTTADWTTVAKEVNIEGASTLGCQTLMVREWLRVMCWDENDTGGKPTALEITRGKQRADQQISTSQSGTSSLLMRYYEGVDLEASFTWTDQTRTLVVKWPKGTPMPAVVGVFQGVSTSPRQPTRQFPFGECKTAAQCNTGQHCCWAVRDKRSFCAPWCVQYDTTEPCEASKECGRQGRGFACLPNGPTGAGICVLNF